MHELAAAVGDSTLQILRRNANSLHALGKRDTHGIWGRFFHHLDWIAFVEQCRPSVWQCLVFIIKGTLSNNEDENAMKTIKSGDSDGIRPSTPVGMLVTTGNFSFVIGLLRLFIGPAMTDREEYHCDRPRGARFAEAMRRRTPMASICWYESSCSLADDATEHIVE